ncbi:cdaR family transcriptional regulator domain protein [Mycobacterium xenopi 4042]|uniref:CdaR family transcriptional regulator domain protein n=1 Tax=Mycobacterium xenopi 4042 TaxID=1299334 RepID=X8DY34_MYCXE|nr:cdaR family transcriptional regulator domain protein [Mycobacterium xenopi 4042]
MRVAGVGLGQLLLALDATMVSLVDAPRGLDLPVASAALIDADDVRLGLSTGADAADVFFLLGVSDEQALEWIERQTTGPAAPAAIFVKEPSATLVARAVAAGIAVVAVEPRARWERLYRLVNHVFEHHGDRSDPLSDSGTDLFGLAQAIADRVHGMVSIEDEQSHVLAYSASNDEADELRRLSILGRAGPPEHLEWISQWGIFDALRSRGEVVRVAERPELGLRPRLAIGIHQRSEDAAGRRFSRAPSGCNKVHSRWPTTPKRCCAAPRCWPPASCHGWPPVRPHPRCGCSSCWAWPSAARSRSATSPASLGSPPTEVSG